MFVLQAINMVLFIFLKDLTLLIIGIIIVGFCFGTTLSVFPSITSDQYGMNNFGMNYGIVFLAWGVAGVFAPMIADFVYDSSAASIWHT